MSQDRSSLFKWLTGSFPVETHSGDELKFSCPKCKHPNFYFNLNKKLGYCHRASCHYTPRVEDLINIVGHGPEQVGYVPETIKKTKTNPGLTPEEFVKKYTVQIDSLRTDVGDGVIEQILLDRRRIVNQHRSDSLKSYFKGVMRFTSKGSRKLLILPVEEKDKIVQYVGRYFDLSKPRIFDVEGGRYSYHPGISISDYFYFEHKNYHVQNQTTVLVENTFNAIILRHHLYGFTAHYGVTASSPISSPIQINTNFGSYLSDTQADKILKSSIRKVIFLWDSGADPDKAIHKLWKRGIRAGKIRLCKGQPDDYNFSIIFQAIKTCEEYLEAGDMLRSFITIDPKHYRPPYF